MVFNEHDDSTETKLGSHSVWKYALTAVQNNSATKDEKNIRGRWKSSTCISDVYDDVELPFPDAKLAGMLGMKVVSTLLMPPRGTIRLYRPKMERLSQGEIMRTPTIMPSQWAFKSGLLGTK